MRRRRFTLSTALATFLAIRTPSGGAPPSSKRILPVIGQ